MARRLRDLNEKEIKGIKVSLGIVISFIIFAIIFGVYGSWRDARTYSAPKLEESFVLVDAVQVTGSIRKTMTLVNCVNYPSNTEKVIVSVCSNDYYSYKSWSQPAETDITGFARTVTIGEGRKRRYFAVKCSNEEFQIVPKKIKKKLYVFVYTKDANPNQEIIYPYFKHENATIFSRSELPKDCVKGLCFLGDQKDLSLNFTVYTYNCKDYKWTEFAIVNFEREEGYSVEYLTSTHDVTEYDFIAIDATDDRSYKYVLSGKRGKLCVNVIDYRGDDLN